MASSGEEKTKKKNIKNTAPKKKRISWISGVRIGMKRLLLAVVIMLPLVYIVSELKAISSEIRNERKTEMESTMISVTEQYANVAVENMVDIAKTITKNDKIYEFLNTYYRTQQEYSAAYQKFRDSRTLSVSDSNAVMSVEIYTENSSVLNGGMINRLTETVKETEWYYELEVSGKNTILFCDSVTGNLSLIRRFDLYPMKYGDSILKMDFSMTHFQSVFDNISFNGKIYISCNHSLLYSNDEKASFNSIYNYGSGQLAVRTSNFYSREICFYVYADCDDTFSRMLKDPVNITCVSLVFLAASIALYVSVDMRKRLAVLASICRGETDGENVDLGKDEIGRLHSVLNELISKHKNDEDQQRIMQDIISNKITRTIVPERTAYDHDSMLSYLKLTDKDRFSGLPDFETLVSFSRELKRLKKYIEKTCHLSSEDNLVIDTSQAEPDDMYIIPYGLVMIAAGLQKMLHKEDVVFKITVAHHGPEVCVALKVPDETLSENSMKKLSNVCLSKDDTIPLFRKFSIYNSFVRIRKYYGDDVRFSISSENDTEVKMFFRAPRMFRKYID